MNESPRNASNLHAQVVLSRYYSRQNDARQPLTLVHALGFRSVICNRPDGEAVDQPLFETIRQLGLNSGIETAYVPLKPEKTTDEDLALMTEMVHQLPKPILAYCGTGARSEALLRRIIESDHEA